MDNKKIEILDSTQNMDEVKWKDFVINHPNGNIFQSPEFYEVYKRSKLCEPLIFRALKDGEIVGLLLVNIRKEFDKILLGNLTSRAIVFGGPLIKNNDIDVLDRILNCFENFVKDRVIYCQFRNLFSFYDQKDIFTNSGFSYIDHLDILVDLSKSENELWQNINSKAKNRIRGAIKKGTKFVVEESVDALEKCYTILKEVYTRIKLPLPDFNYFLNLHNVLVQGKSKLLIFTAQNEGEIIGCLLSIGFNETIYGLYNGAYTRFYDKSPNDLIPWEIFLWAKYNGYKKFDWLGAGKPNVPYGVRDYKMKFGGELINFGRFEKINKPFFYKIGKLGLKLYPRIKGQ